jgi:FkbM family methyltransferase
MVGRLKIMMNYPRSLGLIQGARWGILRIANYARVLPARSVKVGPPGIRFPVSIRMQGSSDADAFDQIFVNRDFEPVRSLGINPKLILDLGANVGYSTAFFLSAFPEAFVLAVEPDPRNVKQCALNLRPYGERAKIVQGAVWHERCALVLSKGTFGDGGEWSTEVRPAREGERSDVPAWDIPSLLQFCPFDTIDLLKIDIEGSEEVLFSNGAERWLNRVRNLYIELHGPRATSLFLNTMANYRFDKRQSGEYVICLNLRPAPFGRSVASSSLSCE